MIAAISDVAVNRKKNSHGVIILRPGFFDADFNANITVQTGTASDAGDGTLKWHAKAKYISESRLHILLKADANNHETAHKGRRPLDPPDPGTLTITLTNYPVANDPNSTTLVQLQAEYVNDPDHNP